jgi:TraB/PrgY/gumN family
MRTCDLMNDRRSPHGQGLALLALMFLTAVAPHVSAATNAASQSVVEEVLVTGEQPGPGLWKVSRGDHALWILGTHAPLPGGLIWRSQEVEWVMTEAQQVLGPYSVSFTLQGAGAFEPTGTKLRRVLPRKTYSQWLVLKKKYLGRNDEVESALPVSAAVLLRSAAFARNGLTNTQQVWRQIETLAERYQIPVTTAHQVDKPISSERRRDDARAQRKGVEYLIDTIENLESDLRAARARANAWATGDIEALRTQAEADKVSAYLYAASWPYLEDEELQALLQETDRRWVAAAESALTSHRTTFAVLPIFLLLRSDGLLSTLRAKGFIVEEPVS